MKKFLPALLLLTMAVLAWWLLREPSTAPSSSGSGVSSSSSMGKPSDTEIKRNATRRSSTATSNAGTSNRAKQTGVDRNRGFDRRISFLEYTAHARCRMECRFISQKEVEELMKEGKINYKKSNISAKPCPTYALEGVSSDGQKLRIVFAQCDFTTKVVTAIDLNNEFSCSCPGDDKK